MNLDFTQTCRLCLGSAKVLYDIYNNFCAKKNIVYSQMLCSCTKLKPSIGDGLPNTICKECARLLKRMYSFNIKCEDSDKKLRHILENQKICNIYEKSTINTIDECKVEEEIKDELDDLSCIENKTEIISYLQDVKNELDDEIENEPCDNSIDDNHDWVEDDEILSNIKSNKRQKAVLNGETKKKRGRKKAAPGALSESKLPHQCDECGKILSTRSNLKVHMISHTDERPHKCDKCNASFKGYSALFQHRKKHTGEKPYHCEYCSKQFARRTGLINHIKTHTGEKQFTCDICFKNFIQNAQLSIHMKRHKGDKTYLCQDCGKGFAIPSDLKVHQRTHNGEKPYSCQLCPKTFATCGNLSIHTRIHNKEIRYQCKVCQRGFVTCSSYNVHLKRHKGQRDYVCDCGKTFYTSSALKQHKVVHTGEKKYQCKICEKKFTQTSHLNRHFKRDHMKPNIPLPSSEHYKVIVPSGKQGKMFLAYEPPVSDVKCERT